MFRTCIFCRSDLGSNEAIEEFQVGRRLAFDPERGRLWVVCRTCERWNLSPLEERWEAVERMEQLFRDTRLRVSTEHIGLARLREGTDLVRIGTPQRPEFAAWRYGDQFGRRRTRAFVAGGLGVAAILAGSVVAPAFLGMSYYGMSRYLYGKPPVIARLEGKAKRPVELKKQELADVILRGVGVDGGFRVVVPVRGMTLEYSGEEALLVAAKLLPAINFAGGSKMAVRSAVDLLESAGDPFRTFEAAARNVKYKKLISQPIAIRMALEMAAHEEQERRALEGELHLLEQAWREAEEVAAIADRLLVPASVTTALARIRATIRS